MTTKYKQIIVMRKDLNMRKGKMIAQGAHAAVDAVLDCKQNYNKIFEKWSKDGQKKICVSVDSEKELFEIVQKAKDSQINIVSVITDSGLTEFDGIPTVTCCALGPDLENKLDSITGHLKLL